MAPEPLTNTVLTMNSLVAPKGRDTLLGGPATDVLNGGPGHREYDAFARLATTA